MLLITVVRCCFTFLPLAYIGFIWYLSSHPYDAVINTGLAFDGKLKEGMHFVEFGILYVLIILGFSMFGGLTYRRNLYGVLLSVVCAFLDELHQYYVPSRSATVTDFLKDGLGVFVAWVVVESLLIYRNGKDKLGVESKE